MHKELRQTISQSMNQRFAIERKIIEKAWSDEHFMQELIDNPKGILTRELGQKIPDEIEIEVIQETNNKVYLVLPNNPIPTSTPEELSEKTLEIVAGGGCAVWTVAQGCAVWTVVSNANDLV